MRGRDRASAVRRLTGAAFAVSLAGLALAGCTTIFAGPAKSIFDLSAPGEVNVPRGGLQVLVPEPTTVRALDTDRIAARPSPSEYAYLPNAIWSDRLPRLLQARLVETLQNSGRVRAASVPGQGLLIDYQIIMDVRAFELSGEAAIADFAVRIMDDRNGRVVRSRVFRYAVALAAGDVGNVVAALDKAMDLAFTDMIEWALS